MRCSIDFPIPLMKSRLRWKICLRWDLNPWPLSYANNALTDWATETLLKSGLGDPEFSFRAVSQQPVGRSSGVWITWSVSTSHLPQIFHPRPSFRLPTCTVYDVEWTTLPSVSLHMSAHCTTGGGIHPLHPESDFGLREVPWIEIYYLKLSDYE